MSELWRKSAVELAALVRSREVSATDVVTDALQRLQTVNPAINAVVAQMPDEALQRARNIDAAIARGEDPGALAGVPVTIKVNTDQIGHASTNGLKLQRDLIASEDSPIVSNFHKAGARRLIGWRGRGRDQWHRRNCARHRHCRLHPLPGVRLRCARFAPHCGPHSGSERFRPGPPHRRAVHGRFRPHRTHHWRCPRRI